MKPNLLRIAVRVSALAVFVYFILGGNYGLINLLSLKLQRDNLEAQNQVLEEEVDRLSTQKESLISDPKVIERIAREEYGMIKDGEFVYVLITGEEGNNPIDNDP